MIENLYTIVIFALGAIILAAFLLVKSPKLRTLLIKAACILCAVCFVYRSLIQDPEYSRITGLVPTFEVSKSLLIFSMLLIWAQGAGAIVAMLAPFFKFKFSSKLATYLSLPIAILNGAFFFVNAKLAHGGGVLLTAKRRYGGICG